ncbi:family 78 glycoside hydrolase catalytic domain [Cohnella zeiphila]|uniref:Family 78 glycoside hydrolase catalytic domain n=1 Tax=Cohnella zeiphila TaxID=2761120 RepID=A0A7X0ST40_9BACL|nr:family 78 glycoside hydrolase catalytic domain [Cohnella zeiphila]MBB6734639.1 family 78 glycoside hydrolase catalytic domain [Cohnella zeiphila]
MNWQASWIWGEGEESPRNEWRCFRKTFEVPRPATKSAALSITADSRYVLFVNGTQVGRGPVRSWPFEQSYDTYEIGHLLKPGRENTIAALVLHFGLSTFYYLRGRGGLLVQLADADGTVMAATDGSWKTSLHPGQHPRAPRMSCQQGFSEYVDASAPGADWMGETFDDSAWDGASVLGPAGMEPWTALKPRDIPMLTEETVYPARVESLAKTKSFGLTTAVDVRAAMVPGSEDHANHVRFTGYAATLVRASGRTKATIGSVFAGECFRACSLNGRVIAADRFYGEQPERYADVELNEGDNLLLIDVSGHVHTGVLHLGVYAEEPVELVFANPVPHLADVSPFCAIGPFDWDVPLDHQPSRAWTWEDPVYQAVLGEVREPADLEKYGDLLRPIGLKYVAEADVFGLCVWRKTNLPLAVPSELQNAVIPNGRGAEVPLFEGCDTEIVIDFGKEYSGYLSFEIEAAEGTILDWYGFEYMSDSYRQHMFGLDHTVRYVAKEGRQTYVSPIRRGFRYLALNVRGAKAPVLVRGVTLAQSNYPVAEVGAFACSDPLLNDIWEISRHTTKLCMEDTFVDCPAYEQTFWVGDSRNEALVSNYLYGVQDILKRCLRLVPGSRTQTPLYADQVPSGWSSVIPNWTFFWAIACQEYYEQTGDRAFAAEMFGPIRYTMDHYLQRIDERGLFAIKGWNLLDWSPIDQPNDGVVAHQNMFLAKTLRVAASMAELAGAGEDASRYGEASNRLADAINRWLWDESNQAYIDCIHADGRRSSVLSMQTQVVASLTGVAQEERKRTIEGYLLNPPAAFVQIGSPFMSFFYYEALAQIGETDRILSDIRRNYGQMIRHGATTCWEMYPNFLENRANPEMLTRSHCHAWSSAPAYFLGRETLGVRSLAPGWTSVEIAPMPCGLEWARGSVPHPAGGRIDVRWTADSAAKRMDLDVTYPADVDVQIRLPDGYDGQIRKRELARL